MRSFEGHFLDFKSGKINSITAEIKSLDNEYVLKVSQTELEKYFIGKYFIEPLILHSDKRTMKRSSTKVSIARGERVYGGNLVDGTKIDIYIPYEGNSDLWRMKPFQLDMSSYPDIKIKLNNEILFSMEYPDDSFNEGKIKSDIERNMEQLKKMVSYMKRDVTNYNKLASETIKRELAEKRVRAQKIIGAIDALDIPIKRVDSKPTFVIPIKRKAKPVRPIAEVRKYKPEPVLEEEEYQYILEILRSMSLAMERIPSALASLDEEAIRALFLIQLNGHYEGDATGETFNMNGKTDILIRVENKNVFIAECKFWDGQKVFREAVGQLLGYLTWRDSKCALIIFNRNKDSSAVRQKMHETMEALPEHIKTMLHEPNGDSRYVLVKESEPGKEIIVTTQLYDIPS